MIVFGGVCFSCSDPVCKVVVVYSRSLLSAAITVLTVFLEAIKWCLW